MQINNKLIVVTDNRSRLVLDWCWTNSRHCLTTRGKYEYCIKFAPIELRAVTQPTWGYGLAHMRVDHNNNYNFNKFLLVACTIDGRQLVR
jgi:hypothetical protein